MLSLTIQDDFASPAEVAAALAAWPVDGWHVYGSQKRASVPAMAMPAPIGELIYRMALQSTGYVPDLGLWGAGLHEMPLGDGLGWHTDAERHALLGLSRRLSSVLYLCGDGWLEFQGAGIAPTPGRLVTFSGSALHRVRPVTQLRRSISLFWYDRPADQNGSTRATFEGGQCH